MALSFFARHKCESYEKTIVEHFTQGLSSLLSVINHLSPNGPGLRENVHSCINQALEETVAAVTELSTWEKGLDLQVENQMSNMERLTLGKKNLGRDLANLRMQWKHAQENRDHALKNLEIQRNHLAELQEQLRQTYREIQEVQGKIDELTPFLLLRGSIGLAVLQPILDKAKKGASDLQKSVVNTERAVSHASRTWEECSRRVVILETETASVAKEMADVENEIAQTKAKEKELSEQDQRLKKGTLFLQRLLGKVEAARVIAEASNVSELLILVLKEISELIQHHVEEGGDNVPFLFNAEVKGWAANLQGATAKLLAVQAH